MGACDTPFALSTGRNFFRERASGHLPATGRHGLRGGGKTRTLSTSLRHRVIGPKAWETRRRAGTKRSLAAITPLAMQGQQ